MQDNEYVAHSKRKRFKNGLDSTVQKPDGKIPRFAQKNGTGQFFPGLSSDQGITDDPRAMKLNEAAQNTN